MLTNICTWNSCPRPGSLAGWPLTAARSVSLLSSGTGYGHSWTWHWDLSLQKQIDKTFDKDVSK